MFRTILTKTLRDYRWGIIIWGSSLALFMISGYTTYGQLDAKALAQVGQVAQTFRYFGEPVAMDTINGLLTWRILGFLPIILSIWGVLAGARMVRGEEDRGSLDTLLATPQSRGILVAQKVGAYALGLVIIGVLIALGALAGAPAAKLTVSLGDALIVGLNVSLTVLLFAMLALFVAQFTRTASAAAGIAGGLLALSYIVEGTGLAVHDYDWIRRFSPFFYYSLTKTLIPSYGTNWGALAVSLIVSLLLLGGSILLFVRRDIGGVAVNMTRLLPARRVIVNGQTLARAERSVTTHSIALRTLAAHRASLLWWSFGIGLYAIWGTSIAKTTESFLADFYRNAPTLQNLLNGANLSTNNGYISYVVFTFISVITVLFVMMQAGSFPSDLDSGRAELLLSTPRPRWRVYLESFVQPLTAAVLAVLVVWLGVVLGAAAAGLTIDAGRVFTAALAFLPLELLIATLVYLLAVRFRANVVTGIVGAYIGITFFADFLNGIAHFPDWVLGLSIFHQYGTPLISGVHWGASIVMLVTSLILLISGTILFSRSDITR